MKDIIEGIKVVVIFVIVIIAFEYSIFLGIFTLIGVVVLFYMNAKNKTYIENPQLRPWLDYKKHKEEQEQINSKPNKNYCSDCGFEIPKNSRFCINCGSKNLK